MHRRRLIVAASAFAASPAAWATDAGTDRAAQVMERWRALGASAPQALPSGPMPPQQAARMAERSALLASGEARLAAGDSEAALADFDRAASMLHAADSEMSLVRAWMQQGEYRRAVAFVAHTAGAHRQVVGGAVLYGWLLSRGGQEAAARRMVDAAGEIDARDPLLAQARDLFERPATVPDGGLLAPPLRLAPYAVGARPPRGARVVAGGVLLADGRHALTSADALRGARGLWLRNGLGQTVKATLAARSSEGAGAVVALRLDAALPVSTEDMPAADPFPGSPGCVLVHQADRAGRAAWPRLHAGFHGMPDDAAPGLRRLGIDLPATPPGGPRPLLGGPVFDAAGRWVGLALPHVDGVPRAAMRSQLARSLGPLVEPPPAARPAPGPRASLDEVYERALRSTLQVIVAA